jgi:hypothetical protein
LSLDQEAALLRQVVEKEGPLAAGQLSPAPGRVVAEMPITLPRTERRDPETLSGLRAEPIRSWIILWCLSAEAARVIQTCGDRSREAGAAPGRADRGSHSVA